MNIQNFCEEQNLMEIYKKIMDDGDIQNLQQQLQRHQQFKINLQTFLNNNPYQIVNDSINKYEELQSNLLNTQHEKNLLEQNIFELDQQIYANKQDYQFLEESFHSLRENIEAQLNMILPNIHEIRVIGDRILSDREMYVNQIDIRNNYSYNIVGAINILVPQNKYFKRTGDQRLRTYVCNYYELNNLIRSLQDINFDDISERFSQQFNNIDTQQQQRSIVLDGLYNIIRLINQNFYQYRALKPLKERLKQIEQELKIKSEIIEVYKQKLSSFRENKRNLEEICENHKQYLDQNENIYNNQKELLMIINQCIKLNKAAEMNINIFQNLKDYKIIKKIIEQSEKDQNNIQFKLLNQIYEEKRNYIQMYTIFDITEDQQNIILDQYNLRNIWIHYNKLFLGECQYKQKFVSDSNQQWDLILKPSKLIIQRLLYVFFNNNLAFELKIRNQDYVMEMIENYLISQEFIFESTSLIMFQSYQNFYFEDNIDEDLTNLFLLLLNSISMVDYDIIDIFKDYSNIVQQYPNKIELIRHILDDFKYFQKDISKQSIRKLLLQQNFNDNEKFLNFILRQLQQQQLIKQIDEGFFQILIIQYGIPSNIIEKYQIINKKLTNHLQQIEMDYIIFQKFSSKAININYLFQMEKYQQNQYQLQLKKVDQTIQQVSAVEAQIKQYVLAMEELQIQKDGLNIKEISQKAFQLNKLQLSQLFLIERPNRFTYSVIEVFLNILGFKGSWEQYKRIIKQKNVFIKINQFNVEDLSYSNVYRIEQIFKQLSFSNNKHAFYGKIIQWLMAQLKLFYLNLKNSDIKQQLNLFSILIEQQQNQIDIMKKNLAQLQKQLKDQRYVNEEQEQLIIFIQQIRNNNFDYQSWKYFYLNFQSQQNLIYENKLIVQFLYLFKIENFSFDEDQLKTYLKISTLQDEFINELIITKILQDNKIVQIGEQNQNLQIKLNQFKIIRAKMPNFSDFSDIEPDHSILIQGAIQKGWLIQQIETNI